MKKEELEALWADPNSWRAWVLYRQPRDPRIIVPKHNRWGGWTINFGHPAGLPTLLAMVLVPLALVLAVLRGGLPIYAYLGLLVVYVIGLIAYSNWESTRPRD